MGAREGSEGPRDSAAATTSCDLNSGTSGIAAIERTRTFFQLQQRRRERFLRRGRGLAPVQARMPELGDAPMGSASSLSFASCDALGLSDDPGLIAVAVQATQAFGLHRDGSRARAARARYTRALEERLARLLRLEQVVLFPTAVAALQGTLTALVRAEDHVFVLGPAPAPVYQAVAAATSRVHLVDRHDPEALILALEWLRAQRPNVPALIIAEAVSSVDGSEVAFPALIEIARRFGATTLVDVTNDLGALGSGPGGLLEAQGALGEVDLVVGSLSRVYASGGGFLATHFPAVRTFVGTYCDLDTEPIAPTLLAVACQALDLAASDEGVRRREELARNSEFMHTLLEQRGVRTVSGRGQLCALEVPDEHARRFVVTAARRQGLQLPDLPSSISSGETRPVCLLLTAKHRAEAIEEAAGLIARIFEELGRRQSAAPPK